MKQDACFIGRGCQGGEIVRAITAGVDGSNPVIGAPVTRPKKRVPGSVLEQERQPGVTLTTSSSGVPRGQGKKMYTNIAIL